MKKLSTLIFLMGLVLSMDVVAQTSGDIVTILQKCIDLPELQQYIPLNTEGNSDQIYVLQHGVSFPFSTEVYKFGKKVQFVDKGQLASKGITSYFLFWEFKVEQDSAKIDFVYNYIGSDNLPKTQRVILEMQKKEGFWAITNSKLMGGEL